MIYSEKLSLKQLLGYAIGAIPVGLFTVIFSLKYIELFYDDLKLLPFYFILGQIIYMIVNAINDPLLGHLSDKTDRKKWGSRRLIYIRYGGPIWAFTFILVWFPWSLSNQLIIFLHYTVSICLFDTLLTLVVLVWMATLPEMTLDSDERNKANFLSLLLGLVAIAPMFIIIGSLEILSVEFQVLMIIVSIISTVLLLLVSKLCEERAEFQEDKSYPLVTSVKETLKLKSFRYFMAYNFCNVFNTSILLSYLFVYVLILGGDSFSNLIGFFLVYMIVGYGSNILCIKLRPKYGMRKIILGFGTLKVLGTFMLFPIIVLTSSNWFIWIGFIWIIFFSGYGVFTTGGLMYLSVDEDEVKSGIRREGMFLGINALFTKPANSLGPIVATLILTTFGYIQDVSAILQPTSAFLGIEILFFIVPAVSTGISLIFIYLYPLQREKIDEIKKNLEFKHKEKKEKLLK